MFMVFKILIIISITAVIIALLLWLFYGNLKDLFNIELECHKQNIQRRQLHKREILADKTNYNNKLRNKVEKKEFMANYKIILPDSKSRINSPPQNEFDQKVDEIYRGWCNAWLERVNCISVFIAILSLVVPLSNKESFIIKPNKNNALFCLAILCGISLGSIWKFSRQSNKVISFDKKQTNHIMELLCIIIWSFNLIFFIAFNFGFPSIAIIITAIVIVTATLTNFLIGYICKIQKIGIINYIKKHNL